MTASNRSTADAESTPAAAATELEFMRKEDSSWHPCHVSLSDTGAGLVINYENTDCGDIVLNEKEILTRLRMHSVPLNGDDCVQIQEGDHVLATEKLEASCLFFDAEVEKVIRVRHSKRAPCRCTFRIKWLHREINKKTSTVTANDIMILDTTNINGHPIVCSFLKKPKNKKCFTSPMPDIDYEMDLHELLEKQIEVISNSVDVSKEGFVKDFQLDVQFNKKGEIQCRAVSKPEVKKPFVLVPSESTTPQRTTRSSKKLQTEIKNPNPPPPDSFIHKLPETPLLNPLAARAAFASLMSKLPHEGKLNVELNFMQSFYKINSPNCPDIYPQTTASLSYEPPSLVTSSEMSTLERPNGNKSSEIPDTTPNLKFSAAKRKLSSPSPHKSSKITQASVAKHSNYMETHVGNKKLISPNSVSRVTCSAVCKINEDENLDSKQNVEDFISDTLINTQSTNPNDAVKRDVVEIFYKGNNNLQEKECKDLDDQLKKNSNRTGRLTRSKVLEGKKSRTMEEASCVLEENKFTESTWLSSFEGKGSAPNGKVACSVESKELVKNNHSSKKNETRRSPRIGSLSQKN